MGSIYLRRIKVTPEWPMVREIRNQILKLGILKNKKIAMATAIAASELLENAIKYGKPEIEIVCEMDSGVLTVSASNEIDKKADLENLKNHINNIKSADDPFDLYVAMLEQVMEQQKNKSLLGLYRIAGEAKFMLDYVESDSRITVFARRRVKKKK